MVSLQKCKLLDQATKKGVYLFFKRNIAHLAHRPTLRTLIIAFAKRLKSLFVQAKFTQTLCIWTIHVPNENNSTIVIRTTSATHRNCSKNVTLVGNKKSILVGMFDLAVTQVDNFCKNELITVMFNLFDGKDASCSFQTETIIEFVCLNAQLYPCNND